MSPLCPLARPLLVTRLAEGYPVPGWVEGHRRRCLRCQALAARTQASIRAMPRLAVVPDPSTPDLVAEVLQGLAPPGRRFRWVGLALGLAGAATVAGWWALARPDLQRVTRLRILTVPSEPPRGVARTG